MVRVILLWTGPKNFCAGMLKKIPEQTKFVLVRKFQIFLNPFLYYQKPVENFSFGPVQKDFVLECLQLFLKKIFKLKSYLKSYY
jgi:hypothetical protein